MKIADKLVSLSIESTVRDEQELFENASEKMESSSLWFSMPHRFAGSGENQVSQVKRVTIMRTVFRLIILVLMAVLYFVNPEEFEITKGFQFFKRFSVLHILWLIWLLDIIMPLFPTRGLISVGSLKHMSRVYIPDGRVNIDRLIAYMKRSTKDSLKVFGIWVLYMVCLTVGLLLEWLKVPEFVCIPVVLNVLDMFFILVWCPFRAFFLKNRCCTTCRIFNWDHIMIFSALFFVPGFFGYSLILLAGAVFVVWEVCFFLHPARFWEGSNCTLRCSNCQDKICPHSIHVKDALHLRHLRNHETTK